MTQLKLYQPCLICGGLVNTYDSAPRRIGHDACGKALLGWDWDSMNDDEPTTESQAQ